MLRERIKRLKLPYHGSFGRGDYIDQLLWGELGDLMYGSCCGEAVWADNVHCGLN